LRQGGGEDPLQARAGAGKVAHDAVDAPAPAQEIAAGCEITARVLFLRSFMDRSCMETERMATILLGDGSLTSCLVIDFSDSGARSRPTLPGHGHPARGRQNGRPRGAALCRGVAVESTEKAGLADIERRLASIEPRSLNPAYWRGSDNFARRIGVFGLRRPQNSLYIEV